MTDKLPYLNSHENPWIRLPDDYWWNLTARLAPSLFEKTN